MEEKKYGCRFCHGLFDTFGKVYFHKLRKHRSLLKRNPKRGMVGKVTIDKKEAR